MINRILVPLDGSAGSKLALPFAEEMAVKLKASVTLFQVVEMIEQQMVPELDLTKLDTLQQRQARANLVSVERELRQKGIAVTHNVVSGIDAAYEIIEVEKQFSVDLVVMSTHGYSTVRRWAFGSVAEKVLRQGDIPLLLVGQTAG